jgi:hypothetical protein
MSKYYISSEVMDMCSNPGKTLPYNEIVESKNEEEAKKFFEFNLLVDDIIVQKIISIHKIDS